MEEAARKVRRRGEIETLLDRAELYAREIRGVEPRKASQILALVSDAHLHLAREKLDDAEKVAIKIEKMIK